MNWLDIVVLILITLLVFNGIRKGFIISLATLIALVLGVWAAMHFSEHVSSFLEKYIHLSGHWLPVLSFSITFLVVLILVILIAKGLEKLVSLAGMGLLNHIAGGFLGLIKGLLLASVLFYIITHFDPKEKLITHSAREKSLFYSYVEKIFPAVVRIFEGDKDLFKSEK